MMSGGYGGIPFMGGGPIGIQGNPYQQFMANQLRLMTAYGPQRHMRSPESIQRHDLSRAYVAQRRQQQLMSAPAQLAALRKRNLARPRGLALAHLTGIGGGF
jgi:hypothetical protein